MTNKPANWREIGPDGRESVCTFCAVIYVAEELEAAVQQRDGIKALELAAELEERAGRIFERVREKFPEAMEEVSMRISTAVETLVAEKEGKQRLHD